jgi:hypothetical protein
MGTIRDNDDSSLLAKREHVEGQASRPRSLWRLVSDEKAASITPPETTVSTHNGFTWTVFDSAVRTPTSASWDRSQRSHRTPGVLTTLWLPRMRLQI